MFFPPGMTELDGCLPDDRADLIYYGSQEIKQSLTVKAGMAFLIASGIAFSIAFGDWIRASGGLLGLLAALTLVTVGWLAGSIWLMRRAFRKGVHKRLADVASGSEQ